MSRTIIASAITLAIATATGAPVAFSAPAGHQANGANAANAASVLTGVAAVAAHRGRTALPGKSRNVRMDRKALGQHRMHLNLGVGPDLDVVRERAVKAAGGEQTWIGHVAGDPDSQVVLTSSGNAVAGSIRTAGRLFALTPDGDGVQRIEELNPGDPLPSTELVADVMPDTIGGDATASTAGVSGAGTIVDLLVAYTPQAKARYGGQSGVEASIALAVAETNQGFLNSQAPVQMRLVGTVETPYSESGDMNTDMVRLTIPGDGYLDELTALRDELGADLVSLVVDTGNYCGLSWQLGVMNPAYAAYGFNVVQTTCLAGYYTLAHELGHNLGLSHDHANATSGLFPYSYGYQDATNAFRTIMAYQCITGCTRVQHFSNPTVTYAGQPTGVPDWADAALALTDTAPLVATWRASVVPFPPLAPTDLDAVAASHEQIDLTWGDLSDEEGYQIERSADGVSFAPIASVAADTTSYSDTGLAPETSYTYRLQAFNGAGISEDSNIAWATTSPAPVTAPNAPDLLTANALSGTEIALTWTDQSDNETSFEVERSSDNGGTWSTVASLAADTQDWIDSTLTSMTSYDYRVRAIGTAGTSAYSNMSSATTLAICSAVGASSLTLADRSTGWNLTNTAGNDLTISRIELIWAKNQRNLIKVRLGGNIFWIGTIAPNSTDLTGTWTSDTARVLDSGSSETLQFDFSASYSKDKQSDYHIVVHFAEGCAVSF